ncbi:hypothetical protein OSCI_3400034 [Kamptonema sp. PCC 6506]|nr:hypothetical protein OSCI_3400034 [Kamptonema sp. PCC 6506]
MELAPNCDTGMQPFWILSIPALGKVGGIDLDPTNRCFPSLPLAPSP